MVLPTMSAMPVLMLLYVAIRRLAKYLALLALLAFVPLASGQALPKHTYLVGGCSAAAEDAVRAFQASKAAPQFDLYIICDSVRWHSLALKNGFQESAVSFTVLKKGMIWLGPKAVSNTVQMREAVNHELEHLRCDCMLGEDH